MEALSFVAFVTVVPILAKIVFSHGSAYRTQRFGFIWGTILYVSALVDTDTLQQKHWDINFWTDAEVIAWKKSHLAFCNAITVAVRIPFKQFTEPLRSWPPKVEQQAAIFASIGLTALQLPNMETVHWSSRACCASSMVLGVASVFTATRQHFSVGMLNSPLQVRLWLSRGRPESYRGFVARMVGFGTIPFPMNRLIPYPVTTATTQRKYANMKAYQDMPLESAISAAKAVALPSHLLYMTVIIFLVGFGLYILFRWLEDVGGAVSYRNIFIVFIITAGLYAGYDILIEVARLLDRDKRSREFATDGIGGLRGQRHLLALQQRLRTLQQRVEDESIDGQDQHQHQHQHQHQPGPAPPHASTAPTGRQTPHQNSPTTASRIDPDPDVDKYQAWESYITAYIQRLGRTEQRSTLMMKIMELKGSLEAEWDSVKARETVHGEQSRTTGGYVASPSDMQLP
ncbi:hypothetical protein A1O3_00565 [Capronia epimyces CBS 606.96]|uniref:Uncharacterized protein n=1 Tax=Capronia epimyces CBS 606.96 TaxID=1182542 RepID=W9YQS6_9EURO|nr:uncharacterized protein A1O3_00565 [Capronia epimyces CBS 606.96]EXJ92015.1 hypothetical protein A1O3_00565 [Capronia epimyces CBS 606.96]